MRCAASKQNGGQRKEACVLGKAFPTLFHSGRWVHVLKITLWKKLSSLHGRQWELTWIPTFLVPLIFLRIVCNLLWIYADIANKYIAGGLLPLLECIACLLEFLYREMSLLTQTSASQIKRCKIQQTKYSVHFLHVVQDYYWYFSKHVKTFIYLHVLLTNFTYNLYSKEFWNVKLYFMSTSWNNIVRRQLKVLPSFEAFRAIVSVHCEISDAVVCWLPTAKSSIVNVWHMDLGSSNGAKETSACSTRRNHQKCSQRQWSTVGS